MVSIEYRYPWARDRWNRFGSASSLNTALDLLDVCRLDNPGSDCRIRDEPAALVRNAVKTVFPERLPPGPDMQDCLDA